MAYLDIAQWSFDGRIILAAQILIWNFLSKWWVNFLKFKYWGRAKNFEKNHTLFWNYLVKTKWVIFSNFVAFSEYQNFNAKNWQFCTFLQFVKVYSPAVTYAAAEHQGHLFWITCKWLKLLRKASHLQVIQNSAPSVVRRCQCDIYKLKEGKINHTNWPCKLEILSSPDQVDFQSHILHHQ